MHDPAMAALFMSILGTMRSALHTRAELALENLALRQQLANLRGSSGRPRLRRIDRAFWLALSRLWSRWADVLVIVKPDTRRSLAPHWISPFLALEVSFPCIQSKRRLARGQSAHPANGRGQRHVGGTSHPRRVAQTRHRHQRAKRVPILASNRPAWARS
jgi:hypothetical protein